MTTIAIYPDNFFNIFNVAGAVLVASALFWAIKKAIKLMQ